MKKYYATELDGENFNYEMYLDEDTLVDNKIAIYGNREYCNMNADLVEDIKHSLENCFYDLREVQEDAENSGWTKKQLNSELLKTVGYYFNKNLSDDDKGSLINLCTLYNDSEDTDIILKAMSINYGKKYNVRTIKGCCQGDWNTLYYPEGTGEDFINFIEAVYFATGTEFAITENMVEPEEADTAETYCDYTYLWNTKDIKEWIAKNNHCDPEDVVVRTIKKRHTHYTYDYEEE